MRLHRSHPPPITECKPRHSNHNEIDDDADDGGNAAADNSCGDGDDDDEDNDDSNNDDEPNDKMRRRMATNKMNLEDEAQTAPAAKMAMTSWIKKAPATNSRVKQT